MPDLFNTDIAQIIADEIGPGLVPAVLIQVSSGSRGANPTGGKGLTETNISGKGFIEDYTSSQMANSLVQKGDRKVVLITNTFTGKPVPTTLDKVLIEGVTYKVVRIERDPAAATYTLQVRA